MGQRDRSRVSAEATGIPAELRARLMKQEINVDEMLSASWDQSLGSSFWMSIPPVNLDTKVAYP
jgi:hypothetical protein